MANSIVLGFLALKSLLIVSFAVVKDLFYH